MNKSQMVITGAQNISSKDKLTFFIYFRHTDTSHNELEKSYQLKCKTGGGTITYD